MNNWTVAVLSFGLAMTLVLSGCGRIQVASSGLDDLPIDLPEEELADAIGEFPDNGEEEDATEEDEAENSGADTGFVDEIVLTAKRDPAYPRDRKLNPVGIYRMPAWGVVEIPATIPVTEGNAGKGKVILKFVNRVLKKKPRRGRRKVRVRKITCTYRGTAGVRSPLRTKDRLEILKGSAYEFRVCRDSKGRKLRKKKPGTKLRVKSRIVLRVRSGDPSAATEVMAAIPVKKWNHGRGRR